MYTYIYSKDIVKLKGCTTRTRPLEIQEDIIVPILDTVIDCQNTDMLSMDNLYVHFIPFHRSVSKTCKFMTVKPVRETKKHRKKDVNNMLKTSVNIYHKI